MDTNVVDRPNLTAEKVPVQEASVGLDQLAAKMAAMREQTLRNQIRATESAGAGVEGTAVPTTPVAPDNEDVIVNEEPEVAELAAEDSISTEESEAPEEVSTDNTEPSEIIDFLEFAETHPNAKFKFKRNGQEIEIDAKKAAAILGQGAAISEDARQLKIQRAEFDEYLKEKQSQTEGLLLALEFTVRPQLQQAYDEIMKTQNYQSTFKSQLAQTRDPAQVARIQAAMAQNEQYIQSQAAVINQLKPNVDQFYQIRQAQVQEILDTNRKNFQDKELRNEYVYNEIRNKLAEGWTGSQGQLVPGIRNLDLVTSDEHILSLIRDGFKYRDKPKTRQSGSSIAALTSKRSGTQIASGDQDEISSLRAKAKGGDKQAADNLLVAQLRNIRATRGR